MGEPFEPFAQPANHTLEILRAEGMCGCRSDLRVLERQWQVEASGCAHGKRDPEPVGDDEQDLLPTF